MSLIRSSASDSAVYRLSAAAAISGFDHKRKLDDYASIFDNGDLVSGSMKKHEPNAVNRPSNDSRIFSGSVSGHSQSPSSVECSCSSGPESESTRVHFFVRMLSEGKTIVLHADKKDTVLTLHRSIKAMTKIPVMEQRLIYRGKQLQYEQSLADCAIEKDACLNLVGRMRSTEHPLAWQVMDDILSTVHRMCRGEAVLDGAQHINERITAFFAMTPRESKDSAMDYLQIFVASSAPAVLVMLYVSSINGNKSCAENCIRHFLTTCRFGLPMSAQRQSALMVLEFCKLLRGVARDQTLYLSCRSTLGSMLETVGIAWGLKNGNEVEGSILGQEILPFISELVDKLSKDLVCSIKSIMSLGPLSSDVCDLSAFLLPLRMAILEHVEFSGPITLSLQKKGHARFFFSEEIEYLHSIFKELLDIMMKCLAKIETWLGPEASSKSENMRSGWSQYLAIFKELHGISKLYQGAEDQLLGVLKSRKTVFCALIIRFAKRIDDHQWILEYKDLTDFEARRHLIMMVFPDVKEDYEELHEMLIDRSHLLAESFEYIGRAEPESLHGGLFMEFKNEEATGPGVLREWFFLVCHAIFDPQNALFVPCPMDHRRFYPNPASKVDPMHLEYFTFSGRVIALALMHKIQVGILFDRVFYLQLAGAQISLEDIRDADPCMYSSCKQILEMDAEFIDSDALGLTFVREIEELGSRKVVELCPGGKNIVVNSKNRGEYVNLLIEHRFVTSISEQISCFSRGFADILSSSKLQKFFFLSLEVEDFDSMLYGSEGAVSVEDWKAYTEYNGYKETDSQIFWFWKIVGKMSAEERTMLLFFWTSMKHLPVEGFRGLASRLQIYKSYESHDRLPSSHTCFYRLSLPQYPSMAVMKDRLKIITQDHVSCSFGTW